MDSVAKEKESDEDVETELTETDSQPPESMSTGEDE